MASHIGGGEGPRPRRPRVAIADDHPEVLVAVGRLLATSCEVVASVRTGRAAIEVVTKVRPEVLVVDFKMPDMDGADVCRQVKQAVPNTVVVIITAFDDSRVQALAFQEGASAVVSKMWVATTLVPTIQRLIPEDESDPDE